MAQIMYIDVRPDTWLASILGCDTYRVSFPDTSSREAGFPTVLKEGTVFAYAKVDPSDLVGIATLEDGGFRLVDTNITFDKQISSARPQPAGHCSVRFARPEDEELTVELARRSFRYSRFHLDPQVSPAKADEIKAEWVRNYFLGQRGDAMVIAEVDGAIAGFIQLLKQNDTLVIDLIAVDDAHRRKSIASDMIAFAETEIENCTKLVVGTQLANVPSMRMYEKSGFRIAGASYVFHYHHRVV